jgi:hypothetical protein
VILSDLAPTVVPVDDLTELERDVLIFERGWWRHAGAKETEIRERFGLSGHRYYQLLGALIDRPEALTHDPQLVNRLRRLREQRAARRAG